MSVDPVNKSAAASGRDKNESFGCAAWLGILLLALAVLAVLFFWLIKPEDDMSKWDWQRNFDYVKKKADSAVDNVNSKLDIAEKCKKLREKVREVEKAGKAMNSSEFFAEAQKTVSEKADIEGKVKKVKQKKEEIEESWY